MLKGTWWVGPGTKFDPDNAVPMPAGTFVTHFGKQVHYDGAKDEETVFLIAGKGHEDYQIVGDTVLPFDDRLVAQEALE